MNTGKTNHQAEHTSSKAIANQADNSGVKMPAVPVLQNKAITQLQKTEEEPSQLQPEAPAQLAETPAAKPNNTGMPDNLKNGIENLSGFAMDDVKVHYNSPKPAQLSAHAYAQGTDIHVAPGQEQHLPHEAWHVVQQKQGRVQPTMQMKNVAVNDDKDLEREADSMGAKAVQMKPTTAFKPLRKLPGNAVAQLTLATVKPDNGPLRLKQQDHSTIDNFSVMKNPGQLEGDEVKAEVGYTGILNVADWADLGRSPSNYWRAHGYAKTFGGAGTGANVGWWPEANETEWTIREQQVRGGESDQNAAWKPHDKEIGLYRVVRNDYPAATLQPGYLAGLQAAATWALNDSRPAWQRMLAWAAKKNAFDVTALNAAKARVANAINGQLQTWLTNVFGSSETNLIQDMTMTYTITSTGANNGGGSRAGFTYASAAPAVNPRNFGLQDNPEEIWKALVAHNQGVFGKSSHPLANTYKRVDSTMLHHVPAELGPQADGWGI